MKYCPTCRTQYTDVTLRFCLQDGALLVDQREGEKATVAFDETPTVIRRGDPQATSRQTNPAVYPQVGRRSSVAFPLIAAATALVLLVAGAAVGIWLYARSQPKVPSDIAANILNANGARPGNINGYSATPSLRSSVSPTPSPSQSASPADEETARREISQIVDAWRSAGEQHDLNSYMSNYADRVDYYNRSGATRRAVRNDKARAFGLYSSINMTLSNMNVSVDDNGTRATAVFDKEWDFSGPRPSSGKVRSELRLRNEGGRWLITGERDLKVYYSN
jgi:hypothetical protein